MKNYVIIVAIIIFSLLISGCVVINQGQGIQNNVAPQASASTQPTPEIIYVTVTPIPTTTQLLISSGTSSISGRVYDANHKAIPNAKVTLYNTKFTMDYVATNPVSTINNPQYTSDGSRSLTGLYQFSDLAPNVYIITVEKNGIADSQTVQVQDGTTTADITIKGYIE